MHLSKRYCNNFKTTDYLTKNTVLEQVITKRHLSLPVVAGTFTIKKDLSKVPQTHCADIYLIIFSIDSSKDRLSFGLTGIEVNTHNCNFDYRRYSHSDQQIKYTITLL